MLKIELELDTTRNLSKYLLEQIYRFFYAPYFLFKKYYKRFEIKKTSKYYKLVNYPILNWAFKYIIIAVIILYCVYTILGIYTNDFDKSLLYTGYIGLILYFFQILKFIYFVSAYLIYIAVRIIKTIHLVLKSLFYESMY